MALATGMRGDEIFELEWTGVGLYRKIAWVFVDKAKSFSARTVPLNPSALKVTQTNRHAQHDTPLFALKELGGWKTLEMVKKYAHLGFDDRQLANALAAGEILEISDGDDKT